MFYTGLAHTEASFLEANFLQHLQGGIEISAGYKPDATCGVEANAAPTVTASPARAAPWTPVSRWRSRRPAWMPTATRSPTRGTSATAEARRSANRRTRSPTAGTYAVKVTVSDGRGGSASATLPVTVHVGSAHASGEVGGDVGLVLGIAMSGAASFGAITPGVTRDYEAGVTALVTSTAGEATLTVTDAGRHQPGPAGQRRLRPGDAAAEQGHQRRHPDGGLRAADGHAADAADVVTRDQQRPGDARVQAVGGGGGDAAGRHLRQDADLHPVDDDSVR